MADRARAGAKRTKAKAGQDRVEPEQPILKPSQCRAYLRRELAREFRGIVQGFVEGAKKGSCQHVKLATELVSTPERRRRRSKGAVQQLIEEFETSQERNAGDL